MLPRDDPRRVRVASRAGTPVDRPTASRPRGETRRSRDEKPAPTRPRAADPAPDARVPPGARTDAPRRERPTRITESKTEKDSDRPTTTAKAPTTTAVGIVSLRAAWRRRRAASFARLSASRRVSPRFQPRAATRPPRFDASSRRRVFQPRAARPRDVFAARAAPRRVSRHLARRRVPRRAYRRVDGRLRAPSPP